MIKLSAIIGIICIHLMTLTAQTKEYQFTKIKDHDLVLTGKGDQPSCSQADNLTDFTYPWNE